MASCPLSGRLPSGRRLPRSVAAALAVLLLGGCVTVRGTGHPAPAALAEPFPALPPVTAAPVPDSYDPSADAAAAVGGALAAARADRRPVLLDFGSAWCADCRALSALVDTPGVHQILARDYHLVTVDVGRYDRNTDLAERYVRLDSSGIPALVLLGPDGRLRRGDSDGRFANARTLDADRFAATLVDWLQR